MHFQFFDLLTANKNDTDLWQFGAHHIKHRKSGDQILFVNAPDPDGGLETAAKKDSATSQLMRK
jgi:hypothetical protein